MEDDKRDDKNSAIDIEFVFDLDANILNPKKVDKDVGDTSSAFSSIIRKGIGNTNKGAWEIGKRVGDKATHFFSRDI